MREDYFSDRRHTEGGVVHAWTAIYISQINVNGTSNRYRTKFLSYARPRCGNNLMIQVDDATVHSKHILHDYFHQEDVTILPWSTKTPCCNPIHNCWVELSRKITSHDPKLASVAELQRLLVTGCDDITVNYINNVIIDSTPHHFVDVTELQEASNK
ncbi:uncharacterized protein LOC143231293 [Tachypleus tridentatus]|uniref:uncharacterized protein LOC143231293 n=1 Tax=Tachypleus tridentatus TaxID=6853 RepID=UPI003FD3DC04